MLLLGSNISEKKVAFLAFQEIYGVGLSKSKALCNLVGIHPNTRLDNLNSIQLNLLAKSCRRLVQGNPKRKKIESIKSLIKISCYRGNRIRNGLPCRGQRTRTNGFTSKNIFSKERRLYKS